MKQTLLTFIIALLAATGAWAQTTFTAENLKYKVTNATAKTVELTGYETEPTGTLTIPTIVSYEGTKYIVTSIGYYAFSFCKALTKVTIPNSVTTIVHHAFQNCEALTEIIFGNGLTTIEQSAFYYCSSLQQVTIPASVTSIENSVFGSCYALTQINVESDNTSYCSENGVLFSHDKTRLVQYPTGKPETSYIIPEGVATITNGAFESCKKLKTVSIPSSMTTIEQRAFLYCSSLTEMTVLATVPPTLGTDAFFNVEFDIPVYVPAKSLNAYKAAEGWKEFTKLQAIVAEFTVGGLTYEVIDQTAKTVEVINFTDELPSTATIPATVSYEGKNYTVTAIASEAFSQNETITEITISEGITSIGDNTFGQCYALTTANIPASLTNMGDWVFDACTALTQINVASGNTAYCSENGILFNKDKTTLICYPAGKPETSYVIPAGVTAVENSAFSYCKTLAAVTIPDGVTSIGRSVFSGCTSLTAVTVPDGVTSIEDFTFNNCTALTKATLGNGVTNIGHEAFSGCTALAEMTVAATEPPTVENVNAFSNVSRTIPVYVPATSLTAYQEADVWSEFTNLQAISTTGLPTAVMPESIRIYNGMLHNPQQLHLTLYDMQGRQVYSGTDATLSQSAGVYVVRCNGASGKVVF